MNKEEQEAIKILEKAKKFYKDFSECDITITIEREDIKKLITLLNYISKLEKENEELKEKIEKYERQLDLDSVDNNFVSKDKIRRLKNDLLEEGKYLTEEQRQNETEFRQGKLIAYEELLKE